MTCLALSILLASVGSDPDQLAGPATVELWQGRWRIVWVEAHPVDDKATLPTELFIQENVFQYYFGSRHGGTGTIKTDATNIDMRWGVIDTSLGIYQWEGRRVLICAEIGGIERPRDFKGSGRNTFYLERLSSK